MVMWNRSGKKSSGFLTINIRYRINCIFSFCWCYRLRSGGLFYHICPWLIYWTYLLVQKCFIAWQVMMRHLKLSLKILILLFCVPVCLTDTMASAWLSHGLQKYFGQDLMFVVRKKITNDLIFEILLFRIFYHLFYCDRGFYLYNKCVFCTRLQVREFFSFNLCFE